MGCKWVFIVKYNSNVSLKIYKATLVAKRYFQTYEIDYLETFTSVAKMNSESTVLTNCHSRSATISI